MQKIREITMENPTGTVYVMVKEAVQKETKNGKPFMFLTITDGETDIQAKIWDSTKESFGRGIGAVLSVDLLMDSYGYTIKCYREATEDEAPITQFIPSPPVRPDILYMKMVNRIEDIKVKELRDLVLTLYENNKRALITSSAAKSMHHNMVGGLLWHQYRMMKAADALAEVYTSIDKDLVVAGCLLHDIGKIYELETDKFGNADYTTDGNLMGHLYIGAKMVDETAVKLNTPVEISRILQHIILSHHGQLEMGAVVMPSCMEAYIVSELDMLDAKQFMFEKAYKEQEPGTFGDKNWGLGNVKIYHPNL